LLASRYDADMSTPRWRLTLADRLVASSMGPEVQTARMSLRPLRPYDFPAWQEVRRRCAQWLIPWEPLRSPNGPDAVEQRRVFEARCEQRDRERSQGTSCGLGMFLDGRFLGECNINNIQRGPQQCANIGYWIDQQWAGRSFMPEAVVGTLAHAFEVIGLHRIEIAIIPRNRPSHRVVEKLQLRSEGIALRFLEINGIWEDHVRYAITAEEWQERQEEFYSRWLNPSL
jgi:[ribosomal protein S5]-alanine N-acetyltransferase